MSTENSSEMAVEIDPDISVIDDDDPATNAESSKDIDIDDDFNPLPIQRELFSKEELLHQIKIELPPLNLYKSKLTLNSKSQNHRTDLYSNIVKVLSNRVNELYVKLFTTYEIDASVVADYIRFASGIEELVPTFIDVLHDLMESFRIDPKVYIIGACYAYNQWNDIISARRYFSNGISFHNDYKQLYLEEFYIEIKYYNRTEHLTHEICLSKYKQIIKMFNNDFNLHSSLVDKVLSSSYKIGVLESNVIRDMIFTYEQNELMWQRLTQLNLEGYHYDFELKSLFYFREHFLRIRNCIQTYEFAMTKLISPDQNFWNYFLDDFIAINNSSHMKIQTVKDFISTKAVPTFLKAFTEGKLHTAVHYCFLLDRGLDPDTQLMVLKKSVTVVKESVELWKRLLSYFIERDDIKNGMEIFKEGTHVLKNDSFTLWEIMELYLMNFDDTMLESFYKQGSCHGKTPYYNINWEIRVRYLQWAVMRHGIETARDVFKVLKKQRPLCLQLYKNMIQLETSSNSRRKEILSKNRDLYSDACTYFGEKNIDIWIDCIRFEYTYGRRSLVPMIYDAAMQCLDLELRTHFITLKNNVDAEFSKQPINDVIIILDDGD